MKEDDLAKKLKDWGARMPPVQSLDTDCIKYLIGTTLCSQLIEISLNSDTRWQTKDIEAMATTTTIPKTLKKLVYWADEDEESVQPLDRLLGHCKELKTLEFHSGILGEFPHLSALKQPNTVTILRISEEELRYRKECLRSGTAFVNVREVHVFKAKRGFEDEFTWKGLDTTEVKLIVSSFPKLLLLTSEYPMNFRSSALPSHIAFEQRSTTEKLF